MSTQAKLQNAEAAVLELSMFFVRHSLPFWSAQMAPVLEALRQGDGRKALDVWGTLALMGEHGLMQVQVSHDHGYRCANPAAEQVHFQRLLDQALLTLNNLRFYLRTGANKPLVDIYPDSPL
ncbi:MAG: hypothetical protein Q8J78_15890 [Moraxellaceae bacterium]|nr:hypothetical protein [Moraxellaceae bacterium]